MRRIVCIPVSAAAEAGTFRATALGLCREEWAEQSRTKHPGTGLGVNRDFIELYIPAVGSHLAAIPSALDAVGGAGGAGAAVVSSPALLSLVELAHPPKYPNCDVEGCAAMGHVDAADGAQAGHAGDRPPDATLIAAALREALEECGVALDAASAMASPLPDGFSRLLHFPEPRVDPGVPITFISVVVPGDWRVIATTIGANGSCPEVPSLRVDKPAKYCGRSAVALLPPAAPL
jgi:hypothetical protein